MTKINHVRKLLETFFEDKTESNVKEMKKHVDEKMGDPINDNTFYTIINKLKKAGILMACEERGVYKWNSDKAAEYMDNRKDEVSEVQSFAVPSWSGGAEDVKQQTHEIERIPIISAEQTPVLKGKNKKMKSALNFVKEMVSFLNIDERYYEMIENPFPIDPWSITPELSESMQILRMIAEGKRRVDSIVQKNEKSK